MNIREVIQIINQMQADGVIEGYAVGGAVGATFYLEPVATLDVDIFVTFKPEAGSNIISPQRIYDYLTAHGGMVQDEYIVISGWPVQFLPPPDPWWKRRSHWRLKKTWPGRPSAFLPPNISPPSRSRRDAPRTRPGCFSSSKTACWIRPAFKPSSPGMDWLRRGSVLSNNFFVTSHDF